MTAIRSRRLLRGIAQVALILILLPVFTTADDFHVCQQSLNNRLVSSPESAFTRPASRMQSNSMVFCVACLWTGFEDSLPGTIATIAPTFRFSFSLPEFDIHSLPTLRIYSDSQRAPPPA